MSNKDLLIQIEEKPLALALQTGEGLDDMISQAREVVYKFDHNIETSNGRKATASLAYRVARLKGKMDDVGKSMVSDIKKQVGVIDGNRRKIRLCLDELKAEARKPLDDWEASEAKRINDIKAALLSINALGVITDEFGNLLDLDALKVAQEMLLSKDITENIYQESFDQAKQAYDIVNTTLVSAISQAQEVAIARKATEEAEAKAKAAEDREARLRAAQEEADSKRRSDEARKVREAEIDKQAADRAASEERERIEAERIKREIFEKNRLAEEEARRQRKSHRSKVEKEALVDIASYLVDPVASASDVLEGIKAGNIRHVKIEY